MGGGGGGGKNIANNTVVGRGVGSPLLSSKRAICGHCLVTVQPATEMHLILL